MRHKKILALLGSCLLLGACSSSPFPPSSPPRPTAQLGTVPPAYQVGDELVPGIEVLDHIPVGELSTVGSAALDKRNPCKDIPPDVVTPAEFAPTPDKSDRDGCGWMTSGVALLVGASPPVSMTEAVTTHIDSANGRTGNALAHLAWLRVDGHYVIERIAKSDRSSGCWLDLDLGSPAVAFVVVVAIDLARDEPAVTSPLKSLLTFCPRARTVARNLLRHLVGPR